jgi:putative transcriptional regulator
MSEHHPTSQYLQDYATGKTSEAVSLIIATHLSMCAECRAELAKYEAIAGAVLADAEPVPVAQDSLDSVLARIGNDSGITQDMIEVSDKSAADALADGDILIPGPLRRYIPASTVQQLNDLEWKNLPGFAEIDLTPEGSSTQIKLMRISAGVTMPQHTHNGTELTLVLHGGYSDHEGSFGPGDLAIATGSHNHAPRADDDGDCICLAVLEAPLKFTGVFGRFLNPFVSF